MYPDDTPPGISAGKFRRRISQKSTARVLTVTRKDDMIMGVADAYGEVSERFMELVLKTSDSQEPRVRIPSSPPPLLPEIAGRELQVGFNNRYSIEERLSPAHRMRFPYMEKYSSW